MECVRAGQRVQMQGEKDLFTVLRVDRLRHLADLLSETTTRKVEAGVPLALLRPATEQDAMSHAKRPPDTLSQS